MRRPNKDKQKITCEHFVWLIGKKKGVYQADGRGNGVGFGRYSLGTTNQSEALEALKDLDRLKAVEAGKIDRSALLTSTHSLTLLEGRLLYEQHIKRPAVTGGTRMTTQKRYRAVLDKFIEWAIDNGIRNWLQVNRQTLERYASYLDDLGKSGNTIYLELTTLKQIVKWLVSEGHLPEKCRITMKLSRDTESTTYCWTLAEFQAIGAYCQQHPALNWLAVICMTLGLTGMRISELAQLRWSNLDLEQGMIRLIDESRRKKAAKDSNQQTLKNKRGRTFPLNQQLIPVFSSMPRHPDGLVFHGPLGGKIKPDTLRNILVKDVLLPLKDRFPAAAGEKGFEHGRLHSFRHFFCSQCANHGVAERVLMTWLGHADAAMVRRYYHLDAKESQRQMNRVSIPAVDAGNGSAGKV